MAPRKSPPNERLAPRALVLAKMPRYPQWPAFIMPKSLIPTAVLRAKRKLTPHCVIFIPDGDFYWMSEKTLEILTSDRLHALQAKVPAEFKRKLHRKSRIDEAEENKRRGRPSNINEAIMAAGGLTFEDFIQRILKVNGKAEDDEDEEEEKEDAENDDEEEEEDADHQDDGRIDEDIDQSVSSNEEHDHMDVDINIEHDSERQLSENDAHTASDDADADSMDTDSRSDTNGKIESRIPQLRKTRGLASRTSISLPLRAKRSRKNKTTTAETLSPISEEEKQHQLWLCRIKLQRSLIQRNLPTAPEDATKVEPPSADELSLARLILYRLLDFPILAESLCKTKIHKVLKCILRDPLLEYADSFKLHERCSELLLKWEPIILEIRSARSLPTTNGDGSEDLSSVREDGAEPTESSKSDAQTQLLQSHSKPKEETDGPREENSTNSGDFIPIAQHKQSNGSQRKAQTDSPGSQSSDQVENTLMGGMAHLQSADVKHDASAATTVM